MKSSHATPPAGAEDPDKDEVAALAYKFYLDSNCAEGHDRENWLCAQYMLTQKEFIRNQINAFHNRELKQQQSQN